MQCPICGLENPEDAQRCSCGYDFHTGAINVRYRFPTLRLLAFLFRLAGWVVFCVGLALFAIWILNRFGYAITWTPTFRAFRPQLNWLPAGRSLSALGIGLLLAGFGELLTMGVAIEHNTRQASRRLDILWRFMSHR